MIDGSAEVTVIACSIAAMFARIACAISSGT